METQVYRVLTCQLSELDKAEKQRMIGEESQKIIALKEEAGARTKRVQELDRQIRLGQEDRSVLCEWDFNFSTGRKRLIRTDTGDAIADEMMSPAERQTTIRDTVTPSPADMPAKPVERGIAAAGRGPKPTGGPSEAAKLPAMFVTALNAVWDGERWLAVMEDAYRDGDDTVIRTEVGEERMDAMTSVWAARWPERRQPVEDAPLQLPPAPAPAGELEELRSELDEPGGMEFAEDGAIVQVAGEPCTAADVAVGDELLVKGVWRKVLECGSDWDERVFIIDAPEDSVQMPYDAECYRRRSEAAISDALVDEAVNVERGLAFIDQEAVERVMALDISQEAEPVDVGEQTIDYNPKPKKRSSGSKKPTKGKKGGGK